MWRIRIRLYIWNFTLGGYIPFTYVSEGLFIEMLSLYHNQPVFFFEVNIFPDDGKGIIRGITNCSDMNTHYAKRMKM